MPWIRRNLRGKWVYARCDDRGVLQTGPDRRVEVLYKLEPNAKIYRANPDNLSIPEGGDEPLVDSVLPDFAPSTSHSDATKSVSGDAIIIYTDGACTGNPGPMALGVVILDGDNRVEISEYLGHGTNNIAELTAILRAIEQLDDSQRDRPVVIHSDSSYSIGLLTKGWKAKANQDLVAEVRAALALLTNPRFVKVKGHAGIPENERCDELARAAIESAQRC